MRVALYHNLPPGGAFRVVREFAQRSGNDIECDAYTLDFGAADAYGSADPDFRMRDLTPFVERQHRVRVPFTGISWLARTRLGKVGATAGVRRAERRVAQMINEGGYDVAYVHGCWLSQTPSILGDLTVPTVFYMQEVRRATFEPGLAVATRPSSVKNIPAWVVTWTVERILQKRDIAAASRADVLLCNSQYSAQTIKSAYGLDPVVTHLGVDGEVFNIAMPERAIANRVVSVGGVEPHKGHHLIVEALGILPAETRPELAMIYERCIDSYRDQLRDLARRLDVRLSEHRGVTDAELARLYSDSTAAVLAAQLEPFGLVPLESMACGRPVVAVRQGGYLETVRDGENGVLVEREPAAIADGIRALLSDAWQRPPQEIRATVLPHWDLKESVARQEGQLRAAAQRGLRP